MAEIDDETVRDVLKELRRKEDSCRVLATVSLPGWVSYRTKMAGRWAQLADAVEHGLFDAMDEDGEMADRIAAPRADASPLSSSPLAVAFGAADVDAKEA